MKLVENIPLNTHAIADLIWDPDDLFLIWPLARHPFDHDQWKEVLEPCTGNIPFLGHQADRTIGHAALCRTARDYVYSVSFVFLSPDYRAKGLGKALVSLLEHYAKEKLQASKLMLIARTYNPRASKCYLGCGFRVKGQHETLIWMSKGLSA